MGSRQLGGLLLRPSPLLRTFQPSLWRSVSTQAPSKPSQDAASKPQSMQESQAALENLVSSTSVRSPSSSDELSAAFRTPNRRYGEGFMTSNKRHSLSRGLNFDRMADPASGAPGAFGNTPTPVVPRQEPEVYPRLNASTGRSIELNDRGRDLVRGLGMLNSLLARNQVKRDFNKQRFHERPGLKRKRLKSERWRRRFKDGFRQVVGRVSELTAKGW
ncbi:hypothetical protein GQ43DRAFT_255421 [Delitschia confertaspora ATCC 74209]|uniref:Ribosomal protein S21 n=1 Tax=Delitschia confertaspora ATCC 74209 TaxID=1513339 RepID=A0A9P4MTV0_9PLEO|nr:hypothetical protein GQ43DRAFT_255421 [Delitschia confertaspora ATCC 74209]